MRNARLAEPDRAAANPIGDHARKARAEEMPAGMRETEAGRRLTLRQLRDWIEALREEHARLVMRVDRLSAMVDRMASRDGAASDRSDAAGSDRGEGTFGREDAEALDRREPAFGRSDAAAFIRSEVPAFDRSDAPKSGSDAMHRPMPEQQAAATDRASFGFAIWAGVERAYGGAAAMPAIGRDDAFPGAEQQASVPRRSAALFRDRPAPEQGRQELPIESLLIELREAARIADEIAANASADEPRSASAHTAGGPDMAGGRISGGDASPGETAGGQASGGTSVKRSTGGQASGGESPERTADGPASGGTSPDRSTGGQSMDGAPADRSTGGQPSGGRNMDRSTGGPAPGGTSAERSTGGQALGGMIAANDPSQARMRHPSPEAAILIPRSERHRARKKRSLWERLFRRQPAGS